MSKILWKSKLDEKYDITVEQVSETEGNLKLELYEGLLFEKKVFLKPGLTISCDSESVYSWMNLVYDYLDGKTKKNDKTDILKKTQKREPKFKEIMSKSQKQKKKERKQGFDKHGKLGE